MESFVLKQTLGGNCEQLKAVDLELLNDEDVAKYGDNQQQQNTASKEIHYMGESGSSSHVLELDFGIVDSEYETINLLSNDSGETTYETENQLQQNKPCSNLTANVVSSAPETSERVVIGDDIEQDIINLLSDDSIDGINMETNNYESFSNEPCSLMMENSEKIVAPVEGNQEPTMDMDDDIQIIENSEMVNLISDSNESGQDSKKCRKISSNNLYRLINPIPSMGYDYLSCCVIDELVQNGFNRMVEQSKMSDERRCEIIRHGRPFPNKDTFFPTYTEAIFKIREKDYTRFPWLTACLKLKQLCCWPCSLIYCEYKVLHTDLINRFGINMLLHHSRQPHHKFAERHYNFWQEELALNKTPKFDSLINYSRRYYDDLRVVEINYNEEEQNKAAPAKPNIVSHKSTGNERQTEQRRTKIEGPKSTKEQQKKTSETTATINPNVVNHRSQGNRSQTTATTKPNVGNHRSVGSQTTKQLWTIKEKPKTTNENPKKTAEITAAESIILFPKSDFLNIKKTASIHPSKTVIITNISKTCKNQKCHRNVPKIASEIASSYSTQPQHVAETSRLYPSTDEVQIVDGSVSLTNPNRSPLPNWFSLLEESLQSSSSDTSHTLESDFHLKNKLMPPSPHIFCSMGISGFGNYYMNSAGIVSYVVVTDSFGKSAQYNGPAQNPVQALKSGDVCSKSKEAPGECIIEDLVDNNFCNSNWTHDQRVQIMRNGGPCPAFFGDLGLQISDHGHMDMDMIHQGKHWLVASKKNRRVVCWPCLLFGELWGFRDTDIKTSKRITSCHKRSQGHRKCCVMYKAWIHENVKTEGKAVFKVSRELLKCLIDVVCSTLMRINNTNVTAGDIFALLRLVACQDTKFSRELYQLIKIGSEVESIGSEISEAKDAEAVVSHFTKRIIESIFICMRDRVILELEHAKFVCLILSRWKNQPWVSVVVRYVTRQGDTVERFVKGIRAESIPSCSILFIKVSDIVDELKCGKKLVGYTLDGAVIKSSEIKRFDFMMTTKYITLKIFHYRAHDLRTALLEKLSESTCIKVFCHHIYGLSKFIEHNEDVMMSLMSIDRGLDDGPLPWDLSSGLIVAINHHYPAFVLHFDKILSHPDNWPNETVVQASRFIEFFRCFHNRFFIAALSEILTSVEPFADALNKEFDLVGLTKEASRAIIALNKAKLNFSCIFELTKSEPLLEPDESDKHYSDIYQSVIRLALDFVNIKADIIGQWYLSECQLYNVLQFPSKDGLCLDRYTRLKQTYIGFKMDLMNNQLKGVQESGFFEPLKNDPIKMIQFLKKFDVVETMSEYYKFLELILTVPMMTTATSSSTRTVDRAVAYIATNESLSTAGWIWINSNLFSTVKQKDDFYANILNSNHLNNTEIVYRSKTTA